MTPLLAIPTQAQRTAAESTLAPRVGRLPREAQVATRPPLDGSALLGARLDLLVSFVVLAERLSFTAAAKVLFLSPSGLSRRISQLETAVGCRLLDRTTRRVRLNDCGRALLPHAAAAIARVEAGAVLAYEIGYTSTQERVAG